MLPDDENVPTDDNLAQENQPAEQPGNDVPVETKTDDLSDSPSESAKPAEKDEPAAVPPVREDWRDKRIAKLTAQLREAQARQNVVPQNPDLNPTVDFELRVREEAQRLAAAEQFNARCLDVVNQGKKEFPDFDSRVENLKRVVAGGDQEAVMQYSNLIAAAIETGEGAKIIHHLGNDLDAAARLMALSPVRMGVELAKLAFKEAPEQVSSAPRPIRNLGASPQHTAIDPTDPSRAERLSTAEWMARRNAQIQDRRQGGRR